MSTKETKETKEAPASNGIKVVEPQIIKKEDLPLVVTPENGTWENEAQAEYAKVLNAYAYANPEKWSNNRIDSNGQEIPDSSKRDVCVKQLAELAKNPGLLNKLSGGSDNVTFSNKLTEK